MVMEVGGVSSISPTQYPSLWIVFSFESKSCQIAAVLFLFTTSIFLCISTVLLLLPFSSLFSLARWASSDLVKQLSFDGLNDEHVWPMTASDCLNVSAKCESKTHVNKACISDQLFWCVYRACTWVQMVVCFTGVFAFCLSTSAEVSSKFYFNFYLVPCNYT